MSDNWLMFIPADPGALPSRAAADKAVELLRTFVPEAFGEVHAKFAEGTEFYSGVANWSGVNCPECGTDIEDWWDHAMDAAWASEFKNLSVTMPCCGHATTLNDPNYVWPAGFSRFVLEAMNLVVWHSSGASNDGISMASALTTRAGASAPSSGSAGNI